MQRDNTEILSPAGSYEAVCAAVSNGADAVYLGGTNFSARRFAKNLTDREIAKAVALCKKHGVKVYVTVNTVIADRELAEALAFCKVLYEIGVSAVIIQDIGLAKLLREYLPELPIHASTQMTVHSLDGANKLAELGFSRVVLARELTAAQIRYITENCKAETEVFVHGALCYCYSGQCLMSAVIGRRSGNRGACAGPCRLPYTVGGKKGYFMSLKDLCLADKVKELAQMGVASLKIEGRMKRAEYVSAVTRVYSKAKRENISVRDTELLSKIFSRSGFTDGYYSADKGAHMLGRKSDENVPENILAAEKRTYQALLKQNFEVNVPDRDMTSAEQFINDRLSGKRGFTKYKIISICKTAEQASAAAEKSHRVFLPIEEFLKCDNLAENVGIDFPTILSDGDREYFRSRLAKSGARYARIHGFGQIDLARESGMEITFSPAFNIYNANAAAHAAELGADAVTLSVEISAPQARTTAKTIGVGMMAYGRIKLMTAENCIAKGAGLCRGIRCAMPMTVTDRAGEAFLVMREGDCKNAIYNSKPLWLADKLADIRALSLTHIELHFTDEDKKRTAEVMASYTGGEKIPPKEYTRGMFDKKVT